MAKVAVLRSGDAFFTGGVVSRSGGKFMFYGPIQTLIVDWECSDRGLWRSVGWSLGLTAGSVRTTLQQRGKADDSGSSQENPFVMNGARRGAPGADAFGAFRPPPPPPSTPRLAVYSKSFFNTQISMPKQL